MRHGRLHDTLSLLKQYGWHAVCSRFVYILSRKAGLLRRRFPMWRWEDRPLRSWLEEGCPPETVAQAKPSLRACGEFFFPPGEPPTLPAAWTAKSAAAATEIRQGRFRYFSHLTGELGYPDPDWMLNPFTGQRDTAARHWTEGGDFSAERGDIKFIWEPARFSWVYALVRAFAADGDPVHAETFWTLVESWQRNNPPNCGPGWQCGQEVAIRLQACAMGLWAFANAPATTPERVANLVVMLAAFAERIEKNIGYARSQHSNHSASEAAGLVTAGVLFPFLKRACRWRALGRDVLEYDAQHYCWADGSYVMHSLNYQRMTLQAYLWCIRLAELNGESFSARLRGQITRQVEFLRAMTDPKTGRAPNYGSNDGALLLPLSDCDYLDYRPVVTAGEVLLANTNPFGEGPWREESLWLCGDRSMEAPTSASTRTSQRFDVGGYYTLAGETTWALFRCHGYRNRPSHADLLHLDLWHGGVNVLRDSGTYLYYDPEENWPPHFATTGFHNTLRIDGASQMQKGAHFRWQSLADARLLTFHRGADFDYIEGEHDGYRRLACRAVHRRAVCRLGDGLWVVADRVTGRGAGPVELLWQLADVPVTGQAGRFELDLGRTRAQIHVHGSVPGETELLRGETDGLRLGWESCYYGEKHPAGTLRRVVAAELPVVFVTLVAFGEPVESRFTPDGKLKWSQGDLAGRALLVPDGLRLVEQIDFGNRQYLPILE